MMIHSFNQSQKQVNFGCGKCQAATRFLELSGAKRTAAANFVNESVGIMQNANGGFHDSAATLILERVTKKADEIIANNPFLKQLTVRK